MKPLRQCLISSLFTILSGTPAFACGTGVSAPSVQLKALSEAVKQAGSKWPKTMRTGEATFYAGTPSYARENKLRYWAATPARRKIPKGVCLLVTNRDQPENKVQVVTADVGSFGGSGRYLDLSVGAARRLDPKFKSTGVLRISIEEVNCGKAG